MSRLPSGWAYAIAATAGAAGWITIAHLTHRREAWDSELYFSWFLPSLAIVVGALGFYAPVRAWRWAYAAFGAQAVVAVVQNPGANLLPLGLVVFAIYGAICSLPAWLGSRLRRRIEQRGTSQ